MIMLPALSLTAQDEEPEFTASANQTTIGADDRIQVTFELNDRGRRFRAPDFGNDFSVYSGPNQSTSMTYVNGRMSAKMSFSYILKPQKKGKLIIEPASIEVNGERISSNPLEITVTDAPQKQPQASSQSKKQSGGQQKKSTSGSDNIYLKVEFSKNNVYKGEQFLATYKLFTRYGVRGVDRQKLPDLSGFYSSEVEFDQGRPVRKVVNGKQYDVYTLKKYILFPQRSGELQLDPIEFDLTVQVREDEPVQTFFGPRYKRVDKKMTLKSRPATITVKPLPKPEPAGFTGAVGSFEYNASVDRNTAETDDGITLTYKISGKGNLSLIDHPAHTLPVEFEVYDPKINTSKSKKATTLSGSKTWEYLMIPRNPGNYSIEIPEFSYFDPQKETYVTRNIPDIELNITGDPSEDAVSASGGTANKREVEQLDSDIRFIKTESREFTTEQNNPFRSAFYWIMLVLPVILGIFLIIYIRKNRELRADVKAYRKHKATKVASKKLKSAKKLLDEGKTDEYYEELYRAINEYLSGKLSIPGSEMNFEKISDKLEESGVEEEVISDYKHILESCEMARFAPAGRETEINLYEKASEAIKKTENALK